MQGSADRLIQRTKTYWYSDGLAEIGFTIICLVLSAYFYGQAMLDPESFWYRILDVSFLLVLLASGLLTRKLITILKTRLTYPRTGHISYKLPGLAQWLASIALAMLIFSAIILTIIIDLEDPGAYLPVITGVLCGIILMFFACRSRILRYYFLAGISTLLGFGLTLSGVGDMLGLSYYYGIMALALLSFGLVILRDYLLKTHPIEG